MIQIICSFARSKRLFEIRQFQFCLMFGILAFSQQLRSRSGGMGSSSGDIESPAPLECSYGLRRVIGAPTDPRIPSTGKWQDSDDGTAAFLRQACMNSFCSRIHYVNRRRFVWNRCKRQRLAEVVSLCTPLLQTCGHAIRVHE